MKCKKAKTQYGQPTDPDLFPVSNPPFSTSASTAQFELAELGLGSFPLQFFVGRVHCKIGWSQSPKIDTTCLSNG